MTFIPVVTIPFSGLKPLSDPELCYIAYVSKGKPYILLAILQSKEYF